MLPLQRVEKRFPGLVNGSNKRVGRLWAWRVASPLQRGAKLNQSAIMLRGNGSNDPIQASVSPSRHENQIPLSDQTLASPHSTVVWHLQSKDESKKGRRAREPNPITPLKNVNHWTWIAGCRRKYFYSPTTAQVTGRLFAKEDWGLLTLSLNKVSTNDKPNSLPKLDVT